MLAVCLLVAGVVRATLPATEFGIAWDHSVEKTRWEERYRVSGDLLELVEARVQSMGAGMEPPPRAALKDGWWRWRGDHATLAELRLTYSTFTTDYRVCWDRHCAELAVVLGQRPNDGDVVSLRPCAAGVAARPPQ